MIKSADFIKRCLFISQKGLGSVAPNPLVGAVIVHHNHIIGEGFHQKYGEAHAEVNAINSVHDKSLLKDSVIYVSLEPCSHYGKTPPCADLIIQHQIPHVVVCNLDPYHEVSGKGIDKLIKAGIKVDTKVEEELGREINRRFFTYIEKKRPYIILKWAQSQDGFISRYKEETKITTEELKAHVHQWRSEEAAILIGKNTLIQDQPQLNTRLVEGNNPRKIILADKNTFSKDIIHKYKNALFINTKNIAEFNQICIEHKIQSILVEGGSKVHQWFVDNNNWDEMRVLTNHSLLLNDGIKAITPLGKLCHTSEIKNESIQIYRNA